jgi:hypothetical protein
MTKRSRNVIPPMRLHEVLGSAQSLLIKLGESKLRCDITLTSSNVPFLCRHEIVPGIIGPQSIIIVG